MLVTHQVQFASQADYIVVFNKGKIKYQGTFNDLKSDANVAHLFTSNYLSNESDNVTAAVAVDDATTEEAKKQPSSDEVS